MKITIHFDAKDIEIYKKLRHEPSPVEFIKNLLRVYYWQKNK
jgi:hypothetical protein